LLLAGWSVLWRVWRSFLTSGFPPPVWYHPPTHCLCIFTFPVIRSHGHGPLIWPFRHYPTLCCCPRHVVHVRLLPKSMGRRSLIAARRARARWEGGAGGGRHEGLRAIGVTIQRWWAAWKPPLCGLAEPWLRVHSRVSAVHSLGDTVWPPIWSDRLWEKSWRRLTLCRRRGRALVVRTHTVGWVPIATGRLLRWVAVWLVLAYWRWATTHHITGHGMAAFWRRHRRGRVHGLGPGDFSPRWALTEDLREGGISLVGGRMSVLAVRTRAIVCHEAGKMSEILASARQKSGSGPRVFASYGDAVDRGCLGGRRMRRGGVGWGVTVR